MKRWRALVLLAVALGAAQSCEDGTGLAAGVLPVRLATPNPGSDKAILVTITGPTALTSASAGPGLRLFSQGLGTTTRFALTGTLTNGTILTIGVADVRRADDYVLTIDDVAAVDFQLRSLAGYSLTVVP